jgi:hypothetical protein
LKNKNGSKDWMVVDGPLQEDDTANYLFPLLEEGASQQSCDSSTLSRVPWPSLPLAIQTRLPFTYTCRPTLKKEAKKYTLPATATQDIYQ